MRAGSQSASSANGCPRQSREGLGKRMHGTIGLAEFQQLRAARHESLELDGVDIDAIRAQADIPGAWSRSSRVRSVGAGA